MTSTLEQTAARLQAHAASHPVKNVEEPQPHEKIMTLYKRGVITEEECKKSLDELSMTWEEAVMRMPPSPSKEMSKLLDDVKGRTRAGERWARLHERGVISEDEANEQLAPLGRTLAAYN